MTQRISFYYNAPLISNTVNERFGDFFGGSVLSGGSFTVGSLPLSINIACTANEPTLVITNNGARVLEDETILNAVTFTSNNTAQDRYDGVYMYYRHGDPVEPANYVAVAGIVDSNGIPYQTLDPAFFTFLGYVRIPANNGSIAIADLHPVSNGFAKGEFAGDLIAKSEAVFQGTAIFEQHAEFNGSATFNDAVTFEENPTFSSPLSINVDAQFNGNTTFQGSVTANSPTQSNEVATKAYVDAVKTGLLIKDAVRVATTANLTLSGAQTIDDVSVVVGDRVLVKAQTDAAENGIYVASSGAWSRAVDMDDPAEIRSGLFCFVSEGTLFKDTGWVLTTNDPISIGSTVLSFTQFSGSGSLSVGDGLSQNGTQLSIAPATSTTLGGVKQNNGLQVTADGSLSLNLGDGLQYDTGTSPNKRATLRVGDGLTWSGTSPTKTVTVNFPSSGGDNGTTTIASRSDHVHDARYYTKTQVDTAFTTNATQAGTGLTKTGTTLSISDTAVTPGTYKSVTVNQQGQVTAGSNPTTLSGYGITDAVSSSDVVTTATANKILKLNASAKLPADITGNAATATTASSVAFSGITGKPTTLSGYGITDAVNVSEVVTIAEPSKLLKLDESGDLPANITGNAASASSVPFSGITGKPTTLAGYGIVDAVNKSGDTMTGFLTLPTDPTSALHAATKQYADAVAANTLTAGTGITKTGTVFSITSTGVTTGTYKSVTVNAQGQVTAGTNPTTLSGYGITDAVASSDVVTTATANKILKLDASALLPTGITGNAATATKWATGRTVALTGDVTGTSAAFDGSGNLSFATTLANSGVTIGTYKSVTVDAKGRVTGGTNPTTLSGYGITDAVNKTGDTMTGALVLSADPTLALHAATKQYVDSAASAATTNATSAITAGTGLTKTSNTLSITNTGVTSGTYKSVTVNVQGQITAGTNPTTLSGYGITDAVSKTGDTMTGSLGVQAIYNNESGIFLPMVGGGGYTTSAQYVTGYLKVTLPVSWTNTMMQFYVDVFNYVTHTSTTFLIAGYNYSTSSVWHTTTAIAVTKNASQDLVVRFGHDGTKCAIYIGESTTTWGYPQIVIRDFHGGYASGATAANWATGWNIDFTTTLGTISSTSTGNLVLSQTANKLATGRTIALTGDATGTSASFDGSANASIAVTLANSGVTTGTYKSVTVDAKGRVTGGTNPTTLSGYGITDAVNKTGDAMTGALVLSGDPTLAFHAATKQYVDSAASSATTNATSAITAGTGLTKIGNTLSITDTGITAGTYKSVTVNAQGQATAGTNPTTLSGYGITDAVASGDVVTTATANKILKLDSTAKLPADITGNSATATKWATGRTVALTGDVTGTSTAFDGSGNLSFATTLANSGVTIGTYRSVTVDAKGRVTAGTNPTTLSGYGITDALSLSGGTLTGALTLPADPSSALHATTKQYVDGLIQGLDFKGSVRVATTANITLSGTQTIDGVAVIAGDRVLVKQQATGSQNGIYVVASGAWTRSTDAENSAEVTPGMYVFVEEGTENGDSAWVLTNTAPVTLDTTALTFSQFSGAGQVVAGTGLSKSANTLSIANTGVTASTYRSVTVNAQGQVTAGTNPTTLSGYGITDAVASTDVVTTATANKILKLDASALLPTGITGNAATATTLATGRTIALTGDATGTSAAFNGSANASIAVTLANSGATAGTYKSVTVDAKGRVTAGTNPTTLSGYGITDALPLGGGTLTGALTLNANPTTALHAATKQYVDDAVSGTTTTLVAGTGISVSGTTISIANTTVTSGTYKSVTVNAQGQVTAGTNPTTLSGYGITDAVASSDVVTTAAANKILKLDASALLPTGITGNAATATKWATGRTVALTGDVTGTSAAFDGSGNLSFATTLANSGVTIGTYRSVTVDIKGRVTGGTNPTTLSGYGITDAVASTDVVTTATANKILKLDANALLPTGITGNAATATTLATGRTIALTGDATGTSAAFNGSANASIAVTLANSGVTAGTYKSVTVDAKGRVTAGTNPTTISGYGITDAVSTTLLDDLAVMMWMNAV